MSASPGSDVEAGPPPGGDGESEAGQETASDSPWPDRRTPRFSVCTPIYGLSMPTFQSCAGYLLSQGFDDWEWCVVDDRETDLAVTRCLNELVSDEPRIRRHTRDAWSGVVAASNDALGLARGEFVAFLDPGDRLVPGALSALAEALDGDHMIDVVYTDEAKLADDGTAYEPFYKPDWSPERLRSQNYCGRLTVMRRTLVDDVGGFRAGFDGAHDHDLVLRVTERARTVGHVARVLYHRHPRPSPTAGAGGDSDGATGAESSGVVVSSEAGRRAVADHMERLGIAATVERLATPGCYRVRRDLDTADAVASELPLVSVILPTAGTSKPVWGIDRPMIYRCLQSLLDVTSYPHVEVVVVTDPATPPSVSRELRGFAQAARTREPSARQVQATSTPSARTGVTVTVVDADGPFNFSRRVNLGAARASGDLILLLNDDMLIEQPDWLDVMVGFTREPDVGAVGCRLLYADGTLQHGGLLCNVQPLHIFHGFGGDEAGPFGLLAIDREVSAVTGACLLTPRAVFDEIGGFPEHFAVTANDLEYCLRVVASGRRVVWTPHATLYHFESQTRAPHAEPHEIAEMYARWGDELHSDPYGNPNFAPKQALWRPQGDPTVGDRFVSRLRRRRRARR